jgi:hypothetical protein
MFDGLSTVKFFADRSVRGSAEQHRLNERERLTTPNLDAPAELVNVLFEGSVT